MVFASLSPSVGHDHSRGEGGFEARLQLVSLTDVLQHDNHRKGKTGSGCGVRLGLPAVGASSGKLLVVSGLLGFILPWHKWLRGS